jgi:hypothetical protein
MAHPHSICRHPNRNMRAMGPLRAVFQTLFAWHTSARFPAFNFSIGTLNFIPNSSGRSALPIYSETVSHGPAAQRVRKKLVAL